MPSAARVHRAHQPLPRIQQPQRVAVEVRDGLAWKNLRAFCRSRWPLCCDPHGDHGAQPVCTESIHHVISIQAAPDRALDVSNLAPVCARCHAKLNAMERTGQPSTHLFNAVRADLDRKAEVSI